MRELLNVKASPRAECSISIKMADAYLVKLKNRHPDAEIDEIDLGQANYPE